MEPNRNTGRVGLWELLVGGGAGTILGLLQGIAILSEFPDWTERSPLLFSSFLIHLCLGCLLATAWGAVYLGAGRAFGRKPTRLGSQAALLSFLVFVAGAIYINAVRLPGTDLLAPVSLGLTAALALGCLGLIPVWRMVLRPMYARFETGPSSGAWLALGAVTIVVALLSFIPPLVSRGGDRAGSPATSPVREDLPHVIVFVMDTTRSDHLSCYGYGRPTTPFLETLAGQGTMFMHTVSPSPWTLPSHASLLTGRFPQTHGATWQHWRLDDANETLAEVLAARGFATGAFVSNPFLSRIFNLDQGFDVYDDELDSWIRRTYLWKLADKARLSPLISRTYSERRGSDTADAVLRWVDGLGQEPFFLFVNFNDPHAPYDPPGEFRGRFLTDPAYSGRLADPASHDDFLLTDEEGLSETDLRHVVDLYDGEILYLDGVMADLFSALEERSGDRSLLIAVVGDHGESFGEHGLLGHRGCLYNQTLSVPLLLMGPGTVPAGVRISSRVQSLDLAPTILDILGFPVPATMEGRSMVSLWNTPAGSDSTDTDGFGTRPCFAELHPEPDLVKRYPRFGRRQAAVLTGRWKLIRGPDEPGELFDLGADPGEEANLARERTVKTASLEETLSAWRKVGGQTAAPVSLDAATADRLRSLGYIQ